MKTQPSVSLPCGRTMCDQFCSRQNCHQVFPTLRSGHQVQVPNKYAWSKFLMQAIHALHPTGSLQLSNNKLAVDLSMSPSEVHAAANRALTARLARKEDDKIWPNIRNLEDFLLHGIQYVFVPERGELNRGMPTAYASAPMDSYFVTDNELPPVWPDPEGEVRGESFSPLYKSAPKAAKKDPKLYQLLALVDAIRGGRARERDIAAKELKKRLEQYA